MLIATMKILHRCMQCQDVDRESVEDVIVGDAVELDRTGDEKLYCKKIIAN